LKSGEAGALRLCRSWKSGGMKLRRSWRHTRCSGTLGNARPNRSHRKHVIKCPKTRYQSPDPKNTLPSTRKHKTRYHVIFGT
jgi:hypothetical protein